MSNIDNEEHTKQSASLNLHAVQKQMLEMQLWSEQYLQENKFTWLFYIPKQLTIKKTRDIHWFANVYYK